MLHICVFKFRVNHAIANAAIAFCKTNEIVLKFSCMGNNVDLMIDDIHKVMWIHQINDYEDEFRKNNYEVLEFPTFYYVQL